MDILSLLFPKTCFGCNQTGSYLCSNCSPKLPKQWLICPVCKRLSPTGKTHANCKSNQGLDGLISLYKYTGTIRRMIGKLKYNFSFTISDCLAQLCVDNLKTYGYFKKPSLVPIPLHTKRKNWRGFNQSEIVGEKIAKKLDWDFTPNLLLRVKYSHPQVGLKTDERLRNNCGIYAVNDIVLKSINQSKTIILFDDVWTTGSTISEACKILKIKGFKHIWGVTIAR